MSNKADGLVYLVTRQDANQTIRHGAADRTGRLSSIGVRRVNSPADFPASDEEIVWVPPLKPTVFF
jgi:hypothetical protein